MNTQDELIQQDIQDAAQNCDEIENIPRIFEIVLNTTNIWKRWQPIFLIFQSIFLM